MKKTETTHDILWEIHHQLTHLLLEYIQNADSSNLNASMLNMIRGFLADNEITYRESKISLVKGLEEINERFPFSS